MALKIHGMPQKFASPARVGNRFVRNVFPAARNRKEEKHPALPNKTPRGGRTGGHKRRAAFSLAVLLFFSRQLGTKTSTVSPREAQLKYVLCFGNQKDAKL